MRKQAKHMRRGAAALAALSTLAGVPARADVSAEALLGVLVRKGVLTADEAAALREEAARETAAPVTSPPVTPTSPTRGPGSDAPAKPPAADPVATLSRSVERLQRTTVTGYLQARATFQKNADPSSQLTVRRARLTIRNTSEAGRMALSFDGGANQVGVRDAYFDWNLTPAVNRVPGYTLRAGQFFRPFGLENERSEADTEFPERTAGMNALFPGFRDIGLNVSRGLNRQTTMDLAVLNGNGSGASGLPGRDNDNYKDLLARLRYARGNAEFALTGYSGRNTVAGTAAVAATTGYVDTDGNGRQDTGEPTVVINPGRAAVPGFTGDRNRLGLAVNVRNVGRGYARAEYIAARDVQTNIGPGARYGAADAQAWFAAYFHPLDSRSIVGIRYDEYDPDTDNRLRLGGDGEIKTLGLMAHRNFADNVKLTIAWERPRATRYTASSQRRSNSTDDLLTLQGQYRF